jgi:hypothetical protein
MCGGVACRSLGKYSITGEDLVVKQSKPDSWRCNMQNLSNLFDLRRGFTRDEWGRDVGLVHIWMAVPTRTKNGHSN